MFCAKTWVTKMEQAKMEQAKITPTGKAEREKIGCIKDLGVICEFSAAICFWLKLILVSSLSVVFRFTIWAVQQKCTPLGKCILRR